MQRSLRKLKALFYFVNHRLPGVNRSDRDEVWKSLTYMEKWGIKEELRMVKTLFLMYQRYARKHGWDFTSTPPRIFTIEINRQKLVFGRR